MCPRKNLYLPRTFFYYTKEIFSAHKDTMKHKNIIIRGTLFSSILFPAFFSLSSYSMIQLDKKSLAHSIDIANMRRMVQVNDPYLRLDILKDLKELKNTIKQADVPSFTKTNLLNEIIDIENTINHAFTIRKNASEFFPSAIYLPPMPDDIDDELARYQEHIDFYSEALSNQTAQYNETLHHDISALIMTMHDFFAGRGDYVAQETKQSLTAKAEEILNLSFQHLQVLHAARTEYNRLNTSLDLIVAPPYKLLVQAQQKKAEVESFLNRFAYYFSKDQSMYLLDKANHALAYLRLFEAKLLLQNFLKQIGELKKNQSSLLPHEVVSAAMDYSDRMEILGHYAPYFSKDEAIQIKKLYRDLGSIMSTAQSRLPKGYANSF